MLWCLFNQNEFRVYMQGKENNLSKAAFIASIIAGMGIIIQATNTPSDMSLYKAFYGMLIIAAGAFLYYEDRKTQQQGHSR